MIISVTFEPGNTDPRIVRIRTTATFAEVTTAGWYKQTPPNQLQPSDKVEIYYGEGSGSAANAFFDVSITAGVVTLSVAESNIILPVVAGDFAIFSGTSGALADLGYSPTDATKAKVVMLDATPVVSGGIASFSAIDGTIEDSGILTSEVQLSANIVAARTGNIGGAGAGPISVAVAGMTAASIITADIQASSNPVEIQSVTATATGFDILFSADPGASVTVNYITFLAAQ